MESEAKTEVPLLVIAGPSGVGKGTLGERLLAAFPQLKHSVSATSRQPRPGEVNGQAYHFMSREDFQAAITADRFIEWVTYNNQYYGTLRDEVDSAIANHQAVLLELDPPGALKMRELYGQQAFLVFLAPPSLEALKTRLEGRGTNTEADIARRLAIAERELAESDRFDAVIVNDELESTWASLKQHVATLLKAEPQATIESSHG